VINDLQKLAREIQNAGVAYAELLKKHCKGHVYIVGLPSDERDARALGFPSIGALMRAVAIAISYLPDNSEIRMVERVRGAIPAPALEHEQPPPTESDAQVLLSIPFNDGKYYTSGNMNRRKFDRLESIGWIKGIATNLSDVEYYLTDAGSAHLRKLSAS
jgi:hypothetical protein